MNIVELAELKAKRDELELKLNYYLDLFDITTGLSNHAHERRAGLIKKMERDQVNLTEIDEQINAITSEYANAIYLM